MTMGDSKASKLFYGGVIPEDQISVADRARKIIRKELDQYADFKLALTNPEKSRFESCGPCKKTWCIGNPTSVGRGRC